MAGQPLNMHAPQGPAFEWGDPSCYDGDLARYLPWIGVRQAEAAQNPPQRTRSGVPSSLPPDHPVHHVQMPRHRIEPVPRGIHARPPRYLLENVRAQNLFSSSRFPVRPSVQTSTRHPDEPVASCRVWPHQYAQDEPYLLALLVPAAGNQDVSGLAGGRLFHHAINIFPACVKESISLWKSHSVANRRAWKCHAGAEHVPGSKSLGSVQIPKKTQITNERNFLAMTAHRF